MRALLMTLALCLPLALPASPARVAALDHGHGLILDDSDIVLWPHLMNSFENRLVLTQPMDQQPGRAGLTYGFGAWGTTDLEWNRPASMAPLYAAQALANSFSDAYTQGGLGRESADTLSETRVASPEPRLAAGYARRLLDLVNAGLGLEWARSERQSEARSLDGLGAGAGSLVSRAKYLSGPGAYYGSLTVSAADDRQFSESLLVRPSLGIPASRFNLDLSADLALNRIDNEHKELLRPTAGVTRGQVAQGLRDQGRASYAAHGRLVVPWRDNNVVLSGGAGIYDLGTRRRVQGSFEGPGLSALQAAGYAHDDQVEDLCLAPWQAFLGVNSRLGKAVLMVAGLGADGRRLAADDSSYAPRAGAARLDDVVRVCLTETRQESLALPLLVAAETEPAAWLKARAGAEYTVWGHASEERRTQRFSQADGSLISEDLSRSQGMASGALALTVGAGLSFGQLVWDHCLDLSAGRLEAARYASSLSYTW